MPVENRGSRPIARLGRYVLTVEEPDTVGGDALQALRTSVADGPSWGLLAAVGLGGLALLAIFRLLAPPTRPRYVGWAYDLDRRRPLMLPPRRA
jgi:hypothetical protein